MTDWTCPNCGKHVPAAWTVCTQCGLDPGATVASVPERAPVVSAYPPQKCLRCDAQMVAMGEVRLHEGTRAGPFLLGGVGELLVNRESYETFACEGCGKVEFFVPKDGRAGTGRAG